MIERLDVTGRGESPSCKGGSFPWNRRWRRSRPFGRWWGGWWSRSDHVDGVKAFNVSTQYASTHIKQRVHFNIQRRVLLSQALWAFKTDTIDYYSIHC